VTTMHLPGEDREAVAMEAHAPAGLERAKLVSPRSVEEACELLAEAHARGQAAVALAGGTDWIVDRHLADVSRARPVDLVVDLTAIDALRTIYAYEDGDKKERRLVVGAGVTYWTLRNDPEVLGTIPLLSRMAKDVGAVQIQTRGTLGGNLASASPAADGVPVLFALEAVLSIASASGTRKVPVESFFVGYRKTVLAPGELILAIDVRVPRAGAFASWQKVGTRLAQAISKVALAGVVETDGAMVSRAHFGMASVGPTTAPLTAVCSAVVGKELARIDRSATDAAVAADIKPIDDVRSTGDYRLHVAKALVWRALHAPP